MLSQLLASIAQLYRTSQKSFYIQINRNEPKLKAKGMKYRLNAKICEQKNVQFKILKFALTPFRIQMNSSLRPLQAWWRACQANTTSASGWSPCCPSCYPRQWTPTREMIPRCRWLLWYLLRCGIVEPAVHNVRQIHIYIKYLTECLRVWLTWQWTTPNSPLFIKICT